MITTIKASSFRVLKLVLGLVTLVALASAPALLPKVFQSPHLSAQGYSGALPNVRKTAATGLGLTYTAGSVADGGAIQAITAGTLTATNTQTSCAAPGYTGCNFVYWTSGTGLSITTTASTAFAPGNIVIAFVTATGGNITLVTPASWSPATAATNTLRPTGSNLGNAYWVPPGNCWYSVATGTLTTPTFGAAPGVTALGLNITLATAPAVPVMQVATTNAAVISVNTLNCLINPPSRIGITGRGVNLVDVDFFYGIQQTGGVNATQVGVLASGTMNGTLVFSKVVMPTAGSAETPSTVAPVRADSGTLAVTPAFASFNSLVTSAGAFFTQKFAPATTFALTGEDTMYYVSMTVLCNTTQATTINTPGVLVHYSE